ncbi:MAG: hypothetical protein AB8G11_23095 [Saprospiraceae bacterium]
MKQSFLLLLFGFLFFNAQSQMIKAIPFEKENSVFKLMYDLPAFASSYEVILTSNYPTGRAFVKVTENALGDVGASISSGNNKTIYWQPEKGKEFNEAILEFKIVMIPLASANNSKDNGDATIIKIPEDVVAKRKAEAEAKKKALESKLKNEENTGDSNSNKPENGTDIGNHNSEITEPQKTNAISGAGAEIPGRTVRSKPVAAQNPGVNGVVIVRVCINTKGDVVRAQFLQNGSTVTNENAIAAAVANANKWKFNENSMAAYKECGVIKFYFKVK